MKIAKVFVKNAVIGIIRKTVNQNHYIERSIYMYAMWPGCYSFRDEIKIMALWMKEWLDSLILKIYELDRILHS